jgi:hypothetical protein
VVEFETELKCGNPALQLVHIKYLGQRCLISRIKFAMGVQESAAQYWV